MRNRMHRQRDAVLYSDLAHEFGHVRLDRALFDAEGGADFFVGAAGYQHLQNFFFAVGEGDASGGEDAAGDELTRSMKVESTRRGAHTEP